MVTQQRAQQSQQQRDPEWVMLSYRIPREPSTPRIAIWRKLKALGIVQVGDGLVALPNSAQTKERIEWIGEQVREADGDAIVWIATPSTRHDTERLEAEMTEARNVEYLALHQEIIDVDAADSRTIAKWRRKLREINRRDYFGADTADAVRLSINELAAASTNRVSQ